MKRLVDRRRREVLIADALLFGKPVDHLRGVDYRVVSYAPG